MNKSRDKILEIVLRRHAQKTGVIKDILERKNVDRNETSKVLEEVKLERRYERIKLVRELDVILENLINERINGEDLESIVRRFINEVSIKYSRLGLSEDTIKSFVGSRGFETTNDMRAFKALCYGDMATYKLFSRDSEILMHCIIRVLALSEKDSVEILKMENLITEAFDQSEEGNAFKRVLRREMGKEGYFLKGYIKDVKKEDVCFYEGILSILPSTLKEGLKNECSNVDDVHEKKEDQTIEEDEIEPISSTEDNESAGLKSTKEDTVERIKLKIEELSGLVEDLELKEEATIEKPSNEGLEMQLEELEKENARLLNEIKRLRAEGVSLKDFVQKAGGKDCNYQLSDLYLLTEDLIEDDGNSIGRLINLVAILESLGVSAYVGDKKFNEEFEIERRELAQKYALEMPLKGDNAVVKVKLIKNGWMLNGNVIVLPLVKQI